MKSLAQYIQEADSIQPGDEFDIELAPDELIEGRVLENLEHGVVLELSESAFDALTSRGLITERIGRYGAVGSSRGMGFTLGEEDDTDARSSTKAKDKNDVPFEPDTDVPDRDQFGNPIKHMARHLARRGMRRAMDAKQSQPVDEDYISRMMELAGLNRHMDEEANTSDPLAAKAAALAPVGTMSDPAQATTVDEGVMSDIDLELQNIAASGDEEALIDALGGLKGNNVALYLEDMMSNLADELAAKGMTDVVRDEDRMIEILMDRIVDTYKDQLDEDPTQQETGYQELAPDNDETSMQDPIGEAEYQGRNVPLGKPMRGDVKKFKVYVKDPKTGNVKKVNFGHGGKSAKRAGEKTLSIKKSNPARRKSFRARHRCDNPGPRTSARYWSCRMW